MLLNMMMEWIWMMRDDELDGSNKVSKLPIKRQRHLNVEWLILWGRNQP
jgi:hypothetical protein